MNLKIDMASASQLCRGDLAGGEVFVYERDHSSLFLAPIQLGYRGDVTTKDIEIGGEHSGSMTDARRPDEPVILVALMATRATVQPARSQVGGAE